jgi:6-pyruvoyltetrahydropterin/6-carboxytetrahydropterin synthase
MKLGVTEFIDCAHFLPNHPKCGALHGHTYRVDLSIEGEIQNGMLIDFGDLKQNLREILARYDHRSWNEFLEYPSVENICNLLSRDLKERMHFSVTVRVWEGHGKWAEL